MQREKFITEREKTIFKKDHHGWTGETYVKIKGYCYHVSTLKNSRGIIHSYAIQINDEGAGNGFISFSYSPLTAKKYELGTETGLATEAKIKEVHLKALARFDQMQDELPSKHEAYKIVVGQVIFLNGYGQDESYHQRRIVYKIDDDDIFTVNEETLKLDVERITNIRDIQEKFGIGIYYKQGDIVKDPDFINNLVIDAHEKIAKDQAEKPAREAKEKADREKAISELIQQYPYLLKETERGGGVHVAKNVRIELKRSFPGIQFRVTSDYSSVNLHWVDGPSIDEVKKITDKYEDHCTDATGDFRDYNPSLFNKVFGGCNYLFENRSWSESTQAKFTEWANKKDVQEANRKANHHFYQSSIPSGDFIITPSGDIEPVAVISQEIKASDQIPAGVTINRNSEKNGIEISFDKKPDDSILESLKKAGFRWSKFNRVWWAKYSDALMETARNIVL